MENNCEKLLPPGPWDDNAICAVGLRDYEMEEVIEDKYIHRAKEPGDFPKNISQLHAKMADIEKIKAAINATKKFEDEFLEEERCGRLWNEPLSKCMLENINNMYKIVWGNAYVHPDTEWGILVFDWSIWGQSLSVPSSNVCMRLQCGKVKKINNSIKFNNSSKIFLSSRRMANRETEEHVRYIRSQHKNISGWLLLLPIHDQLSN
jgi:hypothetical protein